MSFIDGRAERSVFAWNPSPGFWRGLVVVVGLSAFTVMLSMITSCGAWSDDPRCNAEPPDWYYYEGEITYTSDRAYYDHERGQCHSPEGPLSCETVCDEYVDDKCHECRREVVSWHPFESIEQCRADCE